MKPPAGGRRTSPATRFRTEIEQAEAEGVSREEMTLELTLTDVSQLKRDPNVAIADISFSEGTMRFLGVRIQEGGVTESKLTRS